MDINYFLPLTGLFGLSSVLSFGNTKVYQNINKKIFFSLLDLDLMKKILFFCCLSVLLSIPANIFPLLTPTHFLLVLYFICKFGLEESVILVSSISTADFILSIITKQYLGYSRNYVISMANVNVSVIFLFKLLFFSFLLFLVVSTLITLINNIFSRKLINFFVILSIFSPFLLNFNIFSIIILIISGILGFLAIKNNIERISLFNVYLLDYLTNFMKK